MAKKTKSGSITTFIRKINWRTVALEISGFILFFVLFLFATGAFY